MKPQHFDILGSLAFAYVTAFALYFLYQEKMPSWSIILLFLVGIAGLVVDVSIVFRYFIKRK